MTIIGLTGPIAAGKDEVAKLFRRRGATVIDADSLAHQLYSPQAPAWHELVKAFGSKVLLRGGKINRKKLAEIVFADQKKLQLLNKLVHPRLKEKIIQLIASCQSSVVSCPPAGRAGKLIVINAAVLKEIGLLPIVDRVVVVLAPKETRLKRLLKAGLSRGEASRRIKAQLSQAEYLKMADVVIRNDGTKRELNVKVQNSL
ncbi:MAG: dephospho-CoA kinase [Candidatus Margulisiibacteriota bacterium]